VFFPDAKLPKATDENIVTVMQRLFDQLEERFDDLGGLAFGKEISGEESLDNMRFGQCCHGWFLLVVTGESKRTSSRAFYSK
jgi:hypothetical protein